MHQNNNTKTKQMISTNQLPMPSLLRSVVFDHPQLGDFHSPMEIPEPVALGAKAPVEQRWQDELNSMPKYVVQMLG
jgi:hypothetical protein